MVNEFNLRSLIKEMLLTEEIFGAQSFVYHGSPSAPDVFLPYLVDDTFNPGGGAGAMYGKGLYTVYNLKGTKTESGLYGIYIYKLAVNLYGCISFNNDIAQLIYGSPLTPAEQGKLLGLSPQLVNRLEDYTEDATRKRKSSVTTSDRALKASTYLKGAVKGIIYTGSQDGDVVALYDANAVTPVAYRVVGERKGWIPIDKEQIRSKLASRSSFTWQEEKYEKPNDPRITTDPELILKKLDFLSNLPPDQRVFRGNLDLDEKFYKGPLMLPSNLRVTGNLFVKYASATTLPVNLHVEGDLKPPSGLEQLPAGLHVDGQLDLRGCLKDLELPPDIQVDIINHNSPEMSLKLLKLVKNKPMAERIIPGNLFIPDDSPIRSLPGGLTIKGYLRITCPNITALPNGLTVLGDLEATHLSSIPEDIRLGRDLNIRACPITQLPDGLRVTRFLAAPLTLQSVPSNLWVGHDLFLDSCTQITSIPADLTVGGDVYINNLDPHVITTVNPKIKVRGRFIGYTGPKELIPRGLTNRVREFRSRDEM